MRELIQQPEVHDLAKHLLPPDLSARLPEILDTVECVYDFKTKILSPGLTHLLKSNAFSITTSGRSQFSPTGRYLFISNHRDIVMDSALINGVTHEAGLSLPRIAIGDNLLLDRVITTLVRLADAFVVKRKPALREALEESLRLSHYIRTTIVGGEASVWLAQREGRTKDSNDTTQTSILKMLAMSSDERDYDKALEPLHLTPVSLSYEYDPCDYLKAKELLQRELDPHFTKSPLDDLLSMQVGIMGDKGRIHISFAKPLTNLHDLSNRVEKRQDVLSEIAKEIDRHIFLGYRFYPNNYIAYDLLNGGNRFAEMYSTKERASFELYLEGQIDKIVMERKDSNYLLQRLLEMYANPLRNYLITKKELR